MPATTRLIDGANQRAERQARDLGDEIRERRLSIGLSQEVVAAACHLSRGRYRLIELGRTTSVTLYELNVVGAVLGLDLSARIYPGGASIRDRGQASRLATFLAEVGRPLTARIEVPLPQSADRWERRAWDAMLFGGGERTAVELEMRLRDVQAMRRRHEIKRRDDPTEHFLLLIADTRLNRRVLAAFDELFTELPRRRPSDVRQALAAGRHPGTGLLLV